jgi:phosphoglycerate dehydrogenase-like enzyme
MSSLKARILVSSRNTILKYQTMLEDMLRTQQRMLPECEMIIPSHANDEKMFEAEVLQLVVDADVLISNNVSREVIQAGRHLKMIQALGTGVDGIDVCAATERGIVVCNTVGFNAFLVAEHAVALMLALAKGINRYDRAVRSGAWEKARDFPTISLRNKVLGIIGLGSIGIEVARRAKAFGMRIIATKRRPAEKLGLELGIDFLGGPEDLPGILSQSDFVVLSVPTNAETVKLIGEKELRMMKKSAYLINTARGQIVDEKALVKVLTEGAIAGAGLDVFEAQPLRPDNPLLELENVIVTPHVAGGVEGLESALREGLERKIQLFEERAEFVIRNVERLLQGKRPANVVDPSLRYVLEKSQP